MIKDNKLFGLNKWHLLGYVALSLMLPVTTYAREASIDPACQKYASKEELHLFILWENARKKQDEILQDLLSQPNLSVLECMDITWADDQVTQNFTWFYGFPMSMGEYKKETCGGGDFLVISVIDRNPVYGYGITGMGKDCVNVNIFNLKHKYRDMLGPYNVHATDSPAEVNRNLKQLFNKTYAEYLAGAPRQWDGRISHFCSQIKW